MQPLPVRFAGDYLGALDHLRRLIRKPWRSPADRQTVRMEAGRVRYYRARWACPAY